MTQIFFIRMNPKREQGHMRKSSFRNMHLYSSDQWSYLVIRKNRPIPKTNIRKCSVNNWINSIQTYLSGTEQLRTDTNWYEEIYIFRSVRSNMWVSLNKHNLCAHGPSRLPCDIKKYKILTTNFVEFKIGLVRSYKRGFEIN